VRDSRPDPTIFCVVPRPLVPLLLERLREHYRDDPSVQVVPELRGGQRRESEDRREPVEYDRPADRRRVRNVAGRRIGERRAVVEMADLPRPLPAEAVPYAESLILFARRPLGTGVAEDADTARLVVRFQQGEQGVFEDLYLRYFDRVYVYLRLALHNEREAEDATQDVFTKVLIAIPRYQWQGRPFRAWLFTIVRNLALDRLRRRHPEDLVDPARLSDFADSRAQDELPALEWISDRALGALIEQLPLAQRQVLVLRYMLDLRPAEIATVMGLATGHVSVLHHRAMEFLRQRLASSPR
jgi:RNA polymerase sigma-70 factor (ECF subfamily)